ncbi:MAG: hypothetical protein ACI94Y_002635 [Maribacter sp.]|jgi:hypothetical protein
MEDQPYLSIVVTTRNDNHGGDLLARTQCFLNGIYHQAKKFSLPLELIIVEWNPPEDKPLLKDVLTRPAKDDLVNLKYVVVPKEIHDTFRFAKQIPLYQMIAKNVGIRRAKGKFILCTNIDLLFSDECFRILAEKKLETNVFYRANRCDIPKDVLDIASIEEQLVYAKNNIMKRLGRLDLYRHVYNFPKIFYNFPKLLTKIDDIKDKRMRNSSAWATNIIYSLDTDACGDFTLMSKQDWLNIKGYCELDMYSLHVDSMALIAATAIGIEQKLFPKTACSFHIYHDSGWESKYDKPEDLIRFLVGRPSLDWLTLDRTGHKILETGKPYELNNKDWGYANIQLDEYIFEAE